jgi:hypothetical protein
MKKKTLDYRRINNYNKNVHRFPFSKQPDFYATKTHCFEQIKHSHNKNALTQVTDSAGVSEKKNKVKEVRIKCLMCASWS